MFCLEPVLNFVAASGIDKCNGLLNMYSEVMVEELNLTRNVTTCI